MMGIEMLIRTFFCSVVLLCSVSYSVCAEKVNLYSAEQLEFKTEHGVEYVYMRSGKPFVGAITLPDVENLHTTYIYKNGQKNGVAVSYSADEKMVLETTYADGKKNGVEKAYYPNGNPKYQRSYKNDVIDGYEVLFSENGKPHKQSHYENGVLSGEVHYYDEYGNYYKTENYQNGIKNGLERIVKNNSLVAENNYLDGRLHGVSKKFGEKYLTDEIDYIDGTKEGWHKHYNEDGSVVQIPYHYGMKNGAAEVLARVSRKDKDGKAQISNVILQTTAYTDDKKNGFMVKFNKKGLPVSSENYTADKLEGVARYFDEDGKLAMVKLFKNGELAKDVDLTQDEIISQIYSKYKEGRIDSLLKQRNIWYKILWLGISVGDKKLISDLEKALRTYNFALNDMAVYQKFSGADFANQTDNLYFGMTPLMYALSVSAPQEILQKFIKQQQEPDANGEKPLHYVVRLNNPQYVKKLLEFWSGSNDEIKDVLVYALENGVQQKIVAMLIDKAHLEANEINGHSLLDYAMKGNASPDVIMLLIQSGADMKESSNKSLLTEMLRQNKPLVYVTALSEKISDASGVDEEGHSALYYAVINNYPQKIRDVVQKAGAVWNKADRQAMLKRAISLDDVTPIKELNLSSQELNDISSEKGCVLQYAYDAGASAKILQYLIELGADINHQDKDGLTVLHQAIAKGDVDTIKKLVEWDASVNLADKRGNTAISEVLSRDNMAEVQDVVLAKFSAEDAMFKMPNSGVPLWVYLYKNNNMELLSAIFAKVKNPLQLTDDKGRTALDLLLAQPENTKFNDMAMQYFNGEDFEVIRKIAELHRLDLLQKIDTKGADVNALDKNGETLLTLAVKNGADEEFITALLERGVDINKANSNSERALDIALKQNNTKLVEYLLKQGTDVSGDASGQTLMNLKGDDKELTDMLIANEADVSYVTKDGKTVLMAAVENLNLPLVKYALEKGCDVNAKDTEGKTAVLYLFDIIKQHKDDSKDEFKDKVIAVIELLAEHGAELNVRNGDGQTLLIAAAIKHPTYYDELRDAFIAGGGVESLKDQYGKTAADYMAE